MHALRIMLIVVAGWLLTGLPAMAMTFCFGCHENSAKPAVATHATPTLSAHTCCSIPPASALPPADQPEPASPDPNPDTPCQEMACCQTAPVIPNAAAIVMPLTPIDQFLSGITRRIPDRSLGLDPPPPRA